MQHINVALDIYSGIVCFVLLSYLWYSGGRRDRMGKSFLLMCAFSLGIAIGDIPSWLCEGDAWPWNAAAQWAGAILFWLSCTGILVAFSSYIIECLKPKTRVHPGFWRGCLFLGGLHAAGTLLSIFNGMFFTITPDNVYQRGDWFWLSQLIPFGMYALDIAIFITYRKKLSHKDFAILTSYIALPLLSEAIQMLHYGVALLSAGVSLGLLIIFINVQSERELRFERQEKVLAEQRVDIMLSQIQPHFLYNALTAIRRLCDRDPQEAKTAISEFALFLRANMDSLKSKAPIPFDKELNHVQNYLALERQRFQERLHVVYDIQCRNFAIPPLTVQPIVENAVRHGIMKREEGGTVTISSTETPQAYVVIVADDGVGIGASADTGESASHIGLENVRERLGSLCGGTLMIASEPDAGTTVTIQIPKEKANEAFSRA